MMRLIGLRTKIASNADVCGKLRPRLVLGYEFPRKPLLGFSVNKLSVTR